MDEGRNHIEPPHVSISKSCERFWLQPYILFISILSLLAILCFVAFAIQLNTRQDPTFENVNHRQMFHQFYSIFRYFSFTC